MMRRRAQVEHGDASHRTTPLWPGWESNLHPALLGEARSLVDSGALPLHNYAHALNSSQAFAMNLFLPFRVGSSDGLNSFLIEALGRSVEVTGVELEYYGSGDLLAEMPGSTPGPDDKYTAADVALHLRDDQGDVGLLLVEVKLSEAGFTRCGGVKSRGNRDHAPCRSTRVFFESPDRCYLQRPYHATRDRRYWKIFEDAHGSLAASFPGAATDGPCPFEGDWQQPMRNHALCLSAVQAQRASFWHLALLHHDDNPDVVSEWDTYSASTADSRQIHRWPASSLIDALDVALPDEDPAPGQWTRDRYLLGRQD